MENKAKEITDAMSWWNSLGGNPLLRIIKQGELNTKYHGQMRKTSSLKEHEIVNIYIAENSITT